MRGAWVAAALGALALCGCEEAVPPFDAPAVARVGLDLPEGGWASGPWPGQIDDPETEGLIEMAPDSGISLYHGLARDPVEVHCYVGFSESPGRIMPASGNACEIHEIGMDDDGDPPDGRFVVFRNGSGGSFFYRFVLR